MVRRPERAKNRPFMGTTQGQHAEEVTTWLGEITQGKARQDKTRQDPKEDEIRVQEPPKGGIEKKEEKSRQG